MGKAEQIETEAALSRTTEKLQRLSSVDPAVYDLESLKADNWSELNQFIEQCRFKDYRPNPARKPDPDERRIIISDTHGNYRDLYRILLATGAINRDGTRNPGYWVCQIGDLIHGGHEVYNEDSSITLVSPNWIDCQIIGNHDLAFLTGEINSTFSGMHSQLAPGVQDRLQKNLNHMHFQAATEVDGFLITHAGFSLEYLKSLPAQADDPEQISDSLNDLFFARLTRQAGPMGITDAIGGARGGKHDYGSIFWCDWRELLASYQSKNVPREATNLKQIVGHTPTPGAPFRQDNCWITDTLGKEGNGGIFAALIKDKTDSDFTPVTIERSPRKG
jgi:hypothetical protein